MFSTQKIAARAHQVIIWSLHCAVAITPFLFTWFNEELFEFNKMLFIYGVAIIAVAAFLIYTLCQQKITIRYSNYWFLLAFFLVSQVVSTLFSVHIPTSLFGFYTRFNGGLASLLSYAGLFIIATQVLDAKKTKSLLLTLALSAIGVALFAFPEHFGHAFSCLAINGKFAADCWIQDVQSRIFGTFGQPNWLAAYLITCLPVVWYFSYFFWSKKKKGLGLGFGAGVILLVATLLFTQSRSGILGLGVGLGILAVGSLGIWRQKNAADRKKIWQFAPLHFLIGFGVLVGVGLVSIPTPFTPNFLRQTAPQTSVVTPNRLDEGGTDSGEIRKIVWKGAVSVWLRYPLFGSGVETFAYSYFTDRPLEHNQVSEWDFLYNKAHNEFLNYLATTGIFGLSSYILLHVWWAWYLWKIITSKKITDSQKLVGTALTAGIAGLSVSNFFGFSTVVVSFLFFLFPALALQLSNNLGHERTISFSKESTTSTKPVTLTQIIIFSIIGLIALTLLVQVTTTWLADFTFKRGKELLSAGLTQQGINKITLASELRPQQPLFTESLSNLYAQLAVAAAAEKDIESATAYAQLATNYSNTTLTLNPVHLSFYKSRIRVYLTLAQLNPEFLTTAYNTTQVALQLSPTDPKLWYDLGIIEFAKADAQKGLEHLRYALQLKPDFSSALDAVKQYEIQATQSATPALTPMKKSPTTN